MDMAITPVQMVATLEGSREWTKGSVRPCAFSAAKVSSREPGSSATTIAKMMKAPTNSTAVCIRSVQITAEMPPSRV